jgi:antitoxin component of RelBE/YafQ-DinJ toxin-antitoxin module
MPSLMVFLRLRKEDYEVWTSAKEYTKKNGLTLGKLVSLSLQYYINREDRLLKELEEIKALLKNEEAKEEKEKSVKQEKMMNEELKEHVAREDQSLPSYFKNNMWIEILAQRGKDSSA